MGGGLALSAKSGGRHGALSGPHGAVSGPQRMLSAEPSMRDLEGASCKFLLVRQCLFACEMVCLSGTGSAMARKVAIKYEKAITAEDAGWCVL